MFREVTMDKVFDRGRNVNPDVPFSLSYPFIYLHLNTYCTISFDEPLIVNSKLLQCRSEREQLWSDVGKRNWSLFKNFEILTIATLLLNIK